MGLKYIPFLVTLEVNLLLAVVIILSRRADALAKVFVALCLAVSIWCASAFAYYLSGENMSWLMLSLVGVLLIPAIYHYYLARLHGIRLSLSRIGTLAILILIVFAISLFPFEIFGLPVSYVSLPSLAAHMLYFLFMFSSFFLGLKTALNKADSKKTRNQILFIFWSTSIPFALLLVQSAIYPFFKWMPNPNYGFASIIGAELVIYSFISYGRVKADELLSEGTIYLAYMVLISSVVSLVLFMIDRVSDMDFTPAQYIIIILVTSLSALVFVAARDPIRYIVEKIFFREKYKYRILIERYERELAEMQRRLKETERLAMLGEVAAQVAHEIRNPLGPIKGYAQMFLQADENEPPKPEMMKKGIAIITEEVKKIEDRVEKLLEFSRPVRSRTKVNLRRLIEQTVALFRVNPSFSEDIKVRLELKYGLEVLGEQAMIESVLYNLILNAAQACGGTGTIRIKTDQREAKGANWILLEVSDDGPGIDSELQARLFEPFFTRRKSGVGLGLCIVKRVVDEHRGWIEVTSEPDQGATFSIYLPEN